MNWRPRMRICMGGATAENPKGVWGLSKAVHGRSSPRPSKRASMTDDSVRETMTTSDVSRAAAATLPAAPPPGAASVDLTDAHPRTGRLLARWTHPETSARRLLIAAIVYVVCTGVFATIAGPDQIGRASCRE